MNITAVRVFAGLVAAGLFCAVLVMTHVQRHSVPPSLTPLGDLSSCKAYDGLPLNWGKNRHAGMVRIPGGDFELGSRRGYAEERPLQQDHVAAFWMDRTEVTNAEFASFVVATGYVTDAERGDGSAVFKAPDDGQALTPGSWWQLVKGANWRHPEGPDSSIAGRAHEPVVDVTYADALAYAHWLGRALPTEAQWEYAAKAGRGNEDADRALRDAQGRPLANFWQGPFPVQNTDEDGFAGRAPVGCFPANPYGLQDMVGNVWEWTKDLYTDSHAASLADVPDPALTDLSPHKTAVRRVIKGGSFLCADNYCARARASSRQPEDVDLPASHLGFRTIRTD